MNTLINVAETCVGTRALGPGVRSVVWVQGCPFRCPGCLAPEWIPDQPANPMTVDVLADALLADPRVTGLTISGGEPMAQAGPLAELVAEVQSRRPVSVVCFTGYRLDRLRGDAAPVGADRLLDVVDVLIDGLYVERLNDGLGLRGSTNQAVHHLSDRITPDNYNYLTGDRTTDVRIGDRAVTLIGVPPLGLVDRLEAVIDEIGLGTEARSADPEGTWR